MGEAVFEKVQTTYMEFYCQEEQRNVVKGKVRSKAFFSSGKDFIRMSQGIIQKRRKNQCIPLIVKQE